MSRLCCWVGPRGRVFGRQQGGAGCRRHHREQNCAEYCMPMTLHRDGVNEYICGRMLAYIDGRGSDEVTDYLKKIKVVMPAANNKVTKPKFKFLPAKDVQRALGVDYGRRHIGVAVSNLGLAPRPLQFIRGGGIVELMRIAQDVVDVAVAEQCDCIVVGLPVTLEGSLYKRATDSQQGRRCRNFAHTVFSLCEKHSIGVFLVDERGTSQEAGALLDIVGSRQKPKGRKDSVAAALILSAFFGDPSAALRVRSR